MRYVIFRYVKMLHFFITNHIWFVFEIICCLRQISGFPYCFEQRLLIVEFYFNALAFFNLHRFDISFVVLMFLVLRF